MLVSVICTVLNEAATLPRLLDSLARQTRRPDEVVICDGGSRDATPELLAAEAGRGRLALRVITRPGANIAAGRNAAIAAATGDVIAVTDAGVRLDPNWLAELIWPLATQPETQAVAGFFVADARTPFELAMGATVLPGVDEIDPRTFLPSSRSVAFRKGVWARTGGYPEWLDFCEDLIFDFNVRAVCPGGFAFAPRAVAHFQPRGSLGGFFKQYYQYARGDGKADLWRRRHAIRYATYLAGVPLLAWLGLRRGPLGWLAGLAGLAGAAVYLRQPYRRLGRLGRAGAWPGAARLQAAGWVPILRVWGDLAKMIGYPAGLLWRRRVRPPDWRAS